jgi:hypothetical protein
MASDFVPEAAEGAPSRQRQRRWPRRSDIVAAMRLPLFMAVDRLGEAPMISWGIGDDPPEQVEFDKLRSGRSTPGLR